MKSKRLEGWIIFLLYASSALLYVIPFIACATSGICDPTAKDNHLSISHVIRQTYWNTTYAFLTASFVISSACIEYSVAKYTWIKALVVISAFFTAIPAAVPVDNKTGWSAADYLHTIGAGMAAVLQFVFCITLLFRKDMKAYLVPLSVSVASFSLALALLVVNTALRSTSNGSTFENVGFFVSEYLITASVFGALRTIIVSRGA